MAIPYSFRRRKFVFTAIAILLVLGLLADRYSVLPREKSTTRQLESPCLEYFTKLEKASKNWSNEFRSGSVWRDYLPFGSKDGDDVIENVRKLNNFEKCMMGTENIDIARMNDIQARLFPYLNFEELRLNAAKFWPTYTRWDGNVYENSIPRFSLTENSLLEVIQVDYDSSISFWKNWQENFMQKDSRGIVISIGNDQIVDTVRLIRVLRHLQNSLPIEIVHKGDLNKDYQDMLIKIAREDATDSWPGQELWFLDVSHMLKPEFSQKFKRFSNKWLAVLFCSFEHTILLDADTVPFVPLDHFYAREQYERTGTVYFKDRKLTSDLLSKRHLRIFRRIVKSLLGLNLKSHASPASLQEKLTHQLGDPFAAEAVAALFSERYKHHMESGLVVVNKRRHLVNLLTSLSLQFTTVNEYFHGDKEWFWLALFLRNETFTFHPHDASNIGRLGKVISNEEGEFYQICSVQLSHTDLDGSVLWVNGGLSTCKKNSWKYDYENNPRIASKYESVDALQEHYQTPAELEGAIIPEVKKQPWVNSGECARFNYCTLYLQGAFGRLFKFDESTKQKYREIVRVWNLPVYA